MLVLSRQRDESIMIGDDVIITVVDIRGDKVRLGIDTPGEIPVHRREVFDAIQRENKEASRMNGKINDEFRRYLNARVYEGAFDIFYENESKGRYNVGTREEIDKMVHGYQGKL